MHGGRQRSAHAERSARVSVPRMAGQQEEGHTWHTRSTARAGEERRDARKGHLRVCDVTGAARSTAAGSPSARAEPATRRPRTVARGVQPMACAMDARALSSLPQNRPVLLSAASTGPALCFGCTEPRPSSAAT